MKSVSRTALYQWISLCAFIAYSLTVSSPSLYAPMARPMHLALNNNSDVPPFPGAIAPSLHRRPTPENHPIGSNGDADAQCNMDVNFSCSSTHGEVTDRLVSDNLTQLSSLNHRSISDDRPLSPNSDGTDAQCNSGGAHAQFHR